MQKCSNSKKTNSQTKIQTKNNDNSPGSLCEVKWCNYLVIVEMIPFKKAIQTTQPPSAPNVPQFQLFGKYFEC